MPDDNVREIQQVAHQWLAAVEAGDVERLGQLMTSDIVVIHGNGRQLCGRQAVMQDIALTLRDFSVRQTVESEETIVTGEWAFDRATVHTSVGSRRSGETKQYDSRSVTILRKKVNRG